MGLMLSLRILLTLRLGERKFQQNEQSTGIRQMTLGRTAVIQYPLSKSTYYRITVIQPIPIKSHSQLIENDENETF